MGERKDAGEVGSQRTRARDVRDTLAGTGRSLFCIFRSLPVQLVQGVDTAMLEKLGLAKGDEEMSSGRFNKRNESN